MTLPVLTREQRREALLSKFRDIAKERLTALGSGWLRLEERSGDPEDPELAAELARQLHTLKGEARTVGMAAASTVAHHLEGLYHRAHAHAFEFTPEVTRFYLAGLDAITTLIAQPQSPLPQGLLTQLDAALKPETEAPPLEPPATPTLPRAPTAESSAALASVRVSAQRIAAFSDLSLELRTSHAQSEFLLEKMSQYLRRLEVQLHSLEASQQQHDERGATQWAQASSHTLMEALKEVGELRERSRRRSLQLDALERAALELRLVPVSSLLSHYPRAVRDMAAEVGKQVSLRVHGAEAEADKRILEALEEPLLHLVRNSIDHGIESPDERLLCGKGVVGLLELSFRLEGGWLVLELSDDGTGLDLARLRQKAVELKLLDPAAAAALSPQDSLDLVFLPGLTTRATVSPLSGRGVGMDVVKRRVEQLGGTLTLQNWAGRGLRTRLRVPLEVSLTRALLLNQDGQIYALPSTSVDRVQRLKPDEWVSTAQGRVVQRGQDSVPVLDLAELLGLPGATQGERLALLVRAPSSQAYAVQVSAVLGEAELVVRPLRRPLQRHPLVTGAAILPSGAMALVLDVNELLRRRAAPPPVSVRTPEEAGARARSSQHRLRRVLLVDDSPLFRTQVGELLTDLGCAISVAEDGQAGLDALQSLRPDLVVTDIQMPRMNGLDLIQRIREDSRLAHLPVIAVSTLSAPQDRQRALDAGANAYLLKSELNEQSLTTVLAQLVR